MKFIQCAPLVMLLCLMMVIGYSFFPPQSRALRALDEISLEELSPSLQPLDERNPSLVDEDLPRSQLTEEQYNNSKCFNCHRQEECRPSDMTQKQWRMLIEENGHDIFSKIHWESTEQKRQVLIYLLRHAKDYRHEAEGIGVWE